MSNAGFPHPFPTHPPAWGVPDTVPLTKEAVKQYESQLVIDWRQLVNKPSDEAGKGAVFDVTKYGAKGDGIHDDTTAIQAAVDDAKLVKGSVYFPTGTYLVSAPIRTGASGSTHTGISFEGSALTWAYNSGIMGVTLKPTAAFPTGESVLDLRYTKQSIVRFIGVDMTVAAAAGKNVAGLELGERTGTAGMFSNHLIEHCSFHGGYYGIRAANSGILKIRTNNVSGNAFVGIGLMMFCGDSDLEGNYINTNNPDYAGSDDYTGSGILVAGSSGNVAIRGGKVEWNAKGITIYGSNGVIVQGVNFDVNRRYHVWVKATNSTTHAARGFSINSNRFLSGGTTSFGSIGLCAVHVTADSGTAALGNITGNTFRKGGEAAYDLNTGANIGPTAYGIRVESSGTGTAEVTVAGNDMISCAVTATMTASGAGTKVYEGNNATNLPYETYNGAVYRKISSRGASFDVKDYGARGDGTTDDTAAFQAAVNAAKAAGKAPVSVPPGTYRITGTITVTNSEGYGVRIVGSGIETTKIVHELTGNTPVFQFLGGSGTFSNAGLEHMTIQAATDFFGVAVYLRGQCFAAFNNLAIKRCSYGLWLHNGTAAGTFTELNSFRHIQIDYCNDAIRMEKGTGDDSFHGNSFDFVAINLNAGQTGFNHVSGYYYNGRFNLLMWAHSTSSVYLNAGGNAEHNVGNITYESFAKGQFTGTGRFWWSGFLRGIGGVTDNAVKVSSTWQNVIACDNYQRGTAYGTSGFTVFAQHGVNNQYNGPVATVRRINATDQDSVLINSYDAAWNGLYLGSTAFQKGDADGALGMFLSGRGTAIKTFSPTGLNFIDSASTTIFSFDSAGVKIGSGKALFNNGTQVLGSRKTGWAAATGTATRTTFATGTVTLPLLAERVKALIDDLISHGIIGA